MEARFGVDFGGVRVAADGAEVAGRLGARAYALGATIGFAAGEEPRLLGHELAHVAQQWRGGRAELDLDAPKPLDERVLDVVAKVQGATPPLDKALVEEALTLGREVIAALKTAKAGGKDSAADDARQLLARLARALIDKDAEDAAIALAAECEDAAARSLIVNALRNRAFGVKGQQRVLPLMAKLAKEAVSKPAPGQTPQQWLDANTDAIGRTFKAFEAMGLTGLKGDPMWLELTKELLREYFAHAPTDVKPDPKGSLVSPQRPLATDPQSRQILADCDVYATYAARLLRAEGWATAGYLAIFPKEKKPDSDEDRDGHAVALAKRPTASNTTEYLGTSNDELRRFGVQTSDDDAAKGPLLKLALEIYDPPLKAYRAYWLPATAGGGYDTRLLDPEKAGLTPIAAKP
jgi:hypothetical protein